MVPAGEEILRIIHENREAIAGLGVRRIGVFGSYARGDQTESSDIDLPVEFEKKTFDAYMDLKDLLESLFGSSVDLVLSDAVKPQMRDSIMEEMVYAPGFQGFQPVILMNISR